MHDVVTPSSRKIDDGGFRFFWMEVLSQFFFERNKKSVTSFAHPQKHHHYHTLGRCRLVCRSYSALGVALHHCVVVGVLATWFQYLATTIPISNMVPLHFCYQFYACLGVLTLFGGVSVLALALMTLYEVGGVEIVFVLCLACLYGLVTLLLPPWPSPPPLTAAESSSSQQQSLHLISKGTTRKRMAIDTYTVESMCSKLSASCCPICLHNFAMGDMVTQGRKCGHIFHQDCLAIWLCKSPSCPYCRHDLELSDSDPSKSSHKNGAWGIFDGVFDSVYT